MISEKETSENSVAIDNLFKAGAHYGLSKSKRHPSMEPYIFGVKNKIEIFDLEKVADLLENAKAFAYECGKARKIILLVGGKNEAKNVIEQAGKETGLPYVAGRWIGGTLTNFSEIKKRINKLTDLIDKRTKGELTKFTKFEQLGIDREIETLEAMFGGLRKLEGLPHALFVVDGKHEAIAVAEANKMNVPVIGILNSDCNSDGINYCIAGNDSSMASITYFVNEVMESYKKGLLEAPVVSLNKENTEKKHGDTTTRS